VFGGLLVYDILWKAMQKNEQVGVIVTFVLLVGMMAALNFAGKASAR